MPRKEDWRALREEMRAHRLDYYSVPGDLFWDDELSALEQRLLMFIAYLDKGPRGCYASNTYLAAFANCHENTIKTAIKKFVARGFLFEVPWDGIERRLYVNDQYRPLLKGEYPKKKGRTKPVAPLDKNCPTLGQEVSGNMDESSEELYKRVDATHIEPEPSADEVEWALARLHAKHVPIKNPDSPAARQMIREEVARCRAQRNGAG